VYSAISVASIPASPRNFFVPEEDRIFVPLSASARAQRQKSRFVRDADERRSHCTLTNIFSSVMCGNNLRHASQ